MKIRYSFAAVVTLWLISMGWLATTKIVPLFRGGGGPPQAVPLPEIGEQPTTTCWSIEFQNRQIGWASSTITRLDDGAATVQSSVRFNELPLEQMLSRMFGPVSALIQSTVGKLTDVRMRMEVVSHVELSQRGALRRFHSRVDVADAPSLVQLEGEVIGRQLEIVARLGESARLPAGRSETATELLGDDQTFRTSVDVGEQGFVVDSMSPVIQLKRLQVGQKWQFQSYRPFPPNQPLRLVEATVEETELASWDGMMHPVFVVAFRDVAGSGITSAREPFSKLWVRPDGTVIRQQLKISQLEITFNWPNPKIVAEATRLD